MPELPKLSGLTALFKVPEEQFEARVKEATGIEIPTGPQSVIMSIQADIEAGEVPKPAKVLEKIPSLPEIAKEASMEIERKAPSLRNFEKY